MPSDADAQAATWQRVSLGDWAQWLGVDFRGTVRFERRFGCPTGLLPSTRVDLVIDSVDWQAEISLNGQHLGACRWGDAPWRKEIRSFLETRNRLTIDVSLPETPPPEDTFDRGARSGLAGGIIGRVGLDIHDAP